MIYGFDSSAEGVYGVIACDGRAISTRAPVISRLRVSLAPAIKFICRASGGALLTFRYGWRACRMPKSHDSLFVRDRRDALNESAIMLVDYELIDLLGYILYYFKYRARKSHGAARINFSALKLRLSIKMSDWNYTARIIIIFTI